MKHCAVEYVLSTSKWPEAKVARHLHFTPDYLRSALRQTHIPDDEGKERSTPHLQAVFRTLSYSEWQRVVAAVLSRASHSGLISSFQVASSAKLQCMAVKAKAVPCLTEAEIMVNGKQYRGSELQHVHTQ